MSALTNREKIEPADTGAVEMPYSANCEETSVREKLTFALGTILVLSHQLVFRAIVIARRWSY